MLQRKHYMLRYGMGVSVQLIKQTASTNGIGGGKDDDI